MKRQILGLGILLFALWQPAARAEQMEAGDVQAIQRVVQSQLEAFAADDAVAAFALASPTAQDLIGTPDEFLQLIKEQYPPVYRNRLALFSPAEMIDGHALLMVRLTAGDNVVWIAIYEMLRAADGNWKVDGCNLFETKSVSI